MRLYRSFVLGLITVLVASAPIYTQVRIEVPVNNIINGTEFTVVKNVMITNDDKWRPSGINPNIWSISGEHFRHQSLPGNSLPASILLWQLESIGGTPAPFRKQDRLPGFQWFSTSPKNWYEPHSTAGHFQPGNIAFKFKIPSEAFLNNTFAPGEYILNVTHNYGSGSSKVNFIPENFQIVIVIPSSTPIQWKSNNTSLYHEVSTLYSYRSPGNKQISIGQTEIANSVDFNFWGRMNSSSIQFTSSKGVTGNRSPSLIKLGSTHPKIISSPLSANWKNYSPNNPFTVEPGNRNTFELHLSISNTDYKNYFFEAGTYTFQLVFDTRSTDNTSSATQNTDVTLKVLTLSEITIPPSNRTVNFDFNTPGHYSQGQSKVISNQMKLSNNENFELYIKSGTDFFKKAGIQSDIKSNTLQVGVNGTSLVPLSTTSQKILVNGSPVLDQILDIKYTIPANMAQSLISKEKTTYSIDVIYSFTTL